MSLLDDPLNVTAYTIFLLYLVFIGYNLSRIYDIGFNTTMDESGIENMSDMDLLAIKTSFWNTLLLLCMIGVFTFWYIRESRNSNLYSTGASPKSKVLLLVGAIFVCYLGFTGLQLYKMYDLGFNPSPIGGGRYKVTKGNELLDDKLTYRFVFVNSILLYIVLFIILFMVYSKTKNM
jgi:hypothetical protein